MNKLIGELYPGVGTLDDGIQSQVSEEKLFKDIYKQTVSALNQKFAGESDIGPSEGTMRIIISNHSKLKPLRNVWIGRRNMDFFFPQIRFGSEETFQGLVIEVDGAIHHTEFKMKKDWHKFSCLTDLNIFMIPIQSDDLFHSSTTKILKFAFGCGRLDSRAQKRVKRNVHLKTILSNISDKDLRDLYGTKVENSLKRHRPLLKSFCRSSRVNLLQPKGDLYELHN